MIDEKPDVSGLGREIPPTAVSLYSQDSGMDDFPVLKAFQQYIDSEQAKARKRVVSLGIFFMILTGAVIAVFVVLLIGMSDRNQQLNDRLLEYVMRDRTGPSAAAPVVVQQPAQDNSALMALTAKLESMERKLAEQKAAEEKSALEKAAADRLSAQRAEAEREAEEKARAEAAQKAAAEKAELERRRDEEARKAAALKEELETMRLKARLAAEREKILQEKGRRREAELEAYRRKHYPELYEKKDGEKKTVRETRRDAEAGDVVDDASAIRYFDSDDDDAPETSNTEKKKEAPVKKQVRRPQEKKPETAKAAPVDKKPVRNDENLEGWSLP